MRAAEWPPRTALITGAASGLGRQMALQLAEQGTRIAALDCNQEGLHVLARAAPKGAALAWQAVDVTDASGVSAAVAELEKANGPIDLAIASAGIGFATSARDFDALAFASIIQVNLIGVANTLAAVLPGMLLRGRGRIAAISSLASYRGIPLMAGYCASKAGVNALLDAVRVEVAPRGILTTTVCPGWIRTPLTEQLDLRIPNMLEAGPAARTILNAIRKGKPFVAFPRATVNQVRLLRWLPLSVADWLLRRHANLDRRPDSRGPMA
jgi:NAD(P)-dependent dehydrogenase (short-subunit alcohol dehydrogenase family)